MCTWCWVYCTMSLKITTVPLNVFENRWHCNQVIYSNVSILQLLHHWYIRTYTTMNYSWHNKLTLSLSFIVPLDNYSLHNKLGATLANSNNSEDALAVYAQALNIRPKYARGWLNLGDEMQHHSVFLHMLVHKSSHLPSNSFSWSLDRDIACQFNEIRGCCPSLRTCPKFNSYSQTYLGISSCSTYKYESFGFGRIEWPRRYHSNSQSIRCRIVMIDSR